MPVLDRREPGIYVTIEDASYVAPALEVGRVGYVVILGPKGPHDRIVKVTSLDQYYELFGKPNRRKYSQAAYNAVKFLQYSSNLLVCRVVPDDAYWANAYFKYEGMEPITTDSDQFTFTNGSDQVTADAAGIAEIEVGDKIYLEGDLSSDAQEVTAIDTNTNTITLAAAYGGTGGTGKAIKIYRTTSVAFQFVQNSEIVITDAAGYSEVSTGDWIYGDGATENDIVQIIKMEVIDLGGGSFEYRLTLNRKYPGPSVTGPAHFYRGYKLTHKTSVTSESSFDPLDAKVPFYFYATGAGKYYNDIIIKGVRNTDFEKLYTDENGNVLYKYLFMDIGIYYKDPVTGDEKLLEGPWSVSIIPRTPDDNPIRDISSGALMYIEHVINMNSKYVRVVTADGIDDLIYGETAEIKRLFVMLAISSSEPKITQYDTITGALPGGGIEFDKGTDGTGMYATSGLLSPSAALLAKVKRAYNGTMQSVDGTVEQMREVTYPWFEPDYILTGGYPADVQSGGRELAEYRQDCICLADTGGLKTSYSQDLDARLNDVPWNTWCAALYVQYRQISDPFSGEPIWINPTYHAIERHLYCDGAYFLAEPVAGIEKGAIQEPIKLAYKANHTERGDLIDAELNPVIVEPQGKYILTQFTTWKRLSVLKRLHVAKFVAYLRKMIPPLLKDLLQRRATQYWINQANIRVTNFLNNFLENPAVERYSVLKSFNVNVVFDEMSSELNVYIDITPIRAIEKINVFIIVH